jgi:diguanylate cyclase (GGDEF)-like protein
MHGQDESPEHESLDTKTAHFSSDLLRKEKLVRKLPALLVLSGPDAGLRIPLNKPEVVLGRTAESDIAFPGDVQISRRHARILYDEASGNYALSDMGSTNGTFLNEKRVGLNDEKVGVNDPKGASAPLRDGDKIFIGQTIVKFTLEDEVESESGDLFHRYLFRDDLTGLIVKRRFDNELRICLQLAASRREAFSVLMMDMDGLKGVNDKHGHHMGASIISEAGHRIGEICNPRGQACRYGGDEFTAYLVGHNKKSALDVGEMVRSAVRDRPFLKDGVSLQLSISIGVASFPEDGTTPEALSQAADAALYRAKAKGRNAVSD